MMRGSSSTTGMMDGSRPGSASGGMMGRSGAPTASSRSGPVSLGDARTLAQGWLDAHQPGVHVETGGDAFPGYFTFETLRDATITGMISVNASSGTVWPHWWHGAFIARSA